MKDLSFFREAASDPTGYIKNTVSQKDRPIVGFFSPHAPEEIIHAAGLHPFRINSSCTTTAHADLHFQSYACSIVRGALEKGLSGKYSFLKGAVFPHTVCFSGGVKIEKISQDY